MKTSIALIVMLLISFGVKAQTYHVAGSEVEVKPPVFLGVQANVFDENLSIEDYVATTMIYPAEDIDYFREGTEVIQFTVKADGHLKNFVVKNSVSQKLDDEIIRVLETTEGMWRPGTNNDGPVDMLREVSVACKVIRAEGSSGSDFVAVAKNYFKKGSKLLYLKEHPRRALNNFNEGIRYLPNEPNLLVMRGYSRFALGDMNGAIEDWTIVKEKTSIDNLISIATKYKDLNGYNELLSLFAK